MFKAPKLPPPEPIPQRTDPAVEAARKRQLQAEKIRKGRASTILTGGSGVKGEPTLSQPQALGA